MSDWFAKGVSRAFLEFMRACERERKGEKYMMARTRYAGFDVPAMTREGLKKLVDSFNAGEQDICDDTAPEVDCSHVSCGECILYPHGRNKEARAKAFADYARSKGFKITRDRDSMPEIETGMVVRLTDGLFYLCVVKNEDETVLHELCKGGHGVGFVSCCGHRCFPGGADILHTLITDVYYDRASWVNGRPRPWLTPSLIAQIVESGGTKVPCAHWHRPEEPVVKEMTVDEIEKALGYKVKVVGNEKADD